LISITCFRKSTSK